jgi:DNA-binding MarR family transcriptional regulator
VETILEASEAKTRGRGRPRPADVVERDQKLLMYLGQKPRSRAELADLLEITVSQAYLALSRLRSRGQVRRCVKEDGTNVWILITEEGQPCP